MQTPDAVLFDLDGTLIDTAPDFVTVLNLLLKENDKGPLPYESIRAIVSDGARALVKLGFGLEETDPEFSLRRARLLELYSKHLSQESCLFEGMDKVLTTLENQSINWGIVTNKPRAYAEPLIEDLGLKQRCAILVCPDDVTQTKPHAEPILLACSKINALASKSIYVGDHRRDIESGRNAGSLTVACRYGYIPPIENIDHWQADHIINHAEELLAILEQ